MQKWECTYEAIEAHKKGLAISPGYESGLAIAYVRAGQRDKALEIVAEMEKIQGYMVVCMGPC